MPFAIRIELVEVEPEEEEADPCQNYLKYGGYTVERFARALPVGMTEETREALFNSLGFDAKQAIDLAEAIIALRKL